MGGFLISLGTITSAFSTSINEMYITIGLVSGTCQSLTVAFTSSIKQLNYHSFESMRVLPKASLVVWLHHKFFCICHVKVYKQLPGSTLLSLI